MEDDKSVGEDSGGGRVARLTDYLRVAAYIPVYISDNGATRRLEDQEIIGAESLSHLSRRRAGGLIGCLSGPGGIAGRTDATRQVYDGTLPRTGSPDWPGTG